MKIIVPYKDVDGRPYSSIIISGGIERFIKTLAEHFHPNVTVFELKSSKNYDQSMLIDFVKFARDYDLIICNYPNVYFNSLLSVRIDKPIAWICHHSAGVAKNWRETADEMRRFLFRKRNSLWMVSKHQQKRWSDCYGDGFAQVSGIVPPSYASSRYPRSRQKLYDAVTVGRCDEIKDPFLLHRICHMQVVSCVVTNSIDSGYFKNNRAWKKPQMTLVNLDHAEVMRAISKSCAYVSTWPEETYGISVLEALSLGVPVILLTNGHGHASSELFFNKDDGVAIDFRDREGILKAIKEFRRYDDEKRRMISLRALELHSYSSWKTTVGNALVKMAR